MGGKWVRRNTAGFIAMNVSKFFRRYSRILLMVFMALLLVVFLVGDVLQSAVGLTGVGNHSG